MNVVRLMKSIRAEYARWPALRLTVPQARRLWNADEHTCEAAMNALVSAGVLSALPDGSYVPAAAATSPAAVPRAATRPVLLCAVAFDPAEQEQLTAASQEALRHAFADARERGAQVLVLHVAPPLTRHLVLSGGEAASVRGAQRGRAHEILGRLEGAAEQHAPPRRVELRVEYGDPAREIVRTARASGAAAIVLGRPARPGGLDVLLGSTLRRVLARAPCPVVVAAAATPPHAGVVHTIAQPVQAPGGLRER